MKANVAIEITDHERDKLANLIDGKVTKRMVTRLDVVNLCRQHIGGMIQQAESSVIVKQAVEFKVTASVGGDIFSCIGNPLTVVDPEDQVVLAGKAESYIIGWNRVKRDKVRYAKLTEG